MAVEVIMEKCDRCGTCISVCPANALMLLTEILVVDKGRCTRCGACVAICPFGALRLGRLSGSDHGPESGCCGP
ncbi:MAG: 4Fe-4S binding protein [Chitinispirillaceae bacterium]|nr:4Fe-4S binding protein [Chitinispirillaceae bacterium]